MLVFSRDGSGNPFFEKLYFFVAEKSRPTEAHFWAYKKTIFEKRLERTARLASRKNYCFFRFMIRCKVSFSLA